MPPRLRRRAVLLAAVLLAAAGLLAGPDERAGARPGPDPAAAPVLGTNLSAVADWTPSWPFRDVFKTSRGWISGTDRAWDDGRRLALDEHGWVRSLAPGQIARTIMANDRHYPRGRYVVRYAGRGELRYWNGATRVAAGSRPGRDVLDVDPAKGFLGLDLRATDPADPVRDIRVLMPGGTCGAPDRWAAGPGDCPESYRPFEETYRTEPFHPQFLARLAGHGLLRFMDWMATNGSTERRWTDRPLVTDARWTGGVPVEVMVELANRLGADPWFTLPHQADDGYVRGFAEAVRDRLDPGRKVHLELSNELWNDAFPQARWALDRGGSVARGPDPYTARLRFQAARSAQVFAVAGSVLGARRLVRVVATQAATSWSAGVVLDALGPGGADALAIAPYFGYDYGTPGRADRTRRMSLDQLFASLRAEAVPRAVRWMRENAAVARAHGVPLVAYEGGQHLVAQPGVAGGDRLTALFHAANRDPRMHGIYRDYLTGWRAAGGGLFTHFADTARYDGWGCWGALEHLGQDLATAPKERALREYAGG